jgi:hypothetical protein
VSKEVSTNKLPYGPGMRVEENSFVCGNQGYIKTVAVNSGDGGGPVTIGPKLAGVLVGSTVPWNDSKTEGVASWQIFDSSVKETLKTLGINFTVSSLPSTTESKPSITFKWTIHDPPSTTGNEDSNRLEDGLVVAVVLVLIGVCVVSAAVAVAVLIPSCKGGSGANTGEPVPEFELGATLENNN